MKLPDIDLPTEDHHPEPNLRIGDVIECVGEAPKVSKYFPGKRPALADVVEVGDRGIIKSHAQSSANRLFSITWIDGSYSLVRSDRLPDSLKVI